MVREQPLDVVMCGLQPVIIGCFILVNIIDIESVVTGCLSVVVEFDIVESVAFGLFFEVGVDLVGVLK